MTVSSGFHCRAFITAKAVFSGATHELNSRSFKVNLIECVNVSLIGPYVFSYLQRMQQQSMPWWNTSLLKWLASLAKYTSKNHMHTTCKTIEFLIPQTNSFKCSSREVVLIRVLNEPFDISFSALKGLLDLLEIVFRVIWSVVECFWFIWNNNCISAICTAAHNIQTAEKWLRFKNKFGCALPLHIQYTRPHTHRHAV